MAARTDSLFRLQVGQAPYVCGSSCVVALGCETGESPVLLRLGYLNNHLKNSIFVSFRHHIRSTTCELGLNGLSTPPLQSLRY